ncbi:MULTISPECIES: ATP-binding protein [unclassified Streptomyces]|uniref:ATP-binding protein n=1 Tax=unclassified Streptomyces TaxID=2593676 RepID=UPI000361D22B|nr:ATP-binding protein [Streptomyces sp. HmicA12]
MNEQIEQHHIYSLSLTVGTHSARHVRRIIHRLCGDWSVPQELADDMALGVTELLSNVVRHVPGARAEVRLHHDTEAGYVRAEVTDDGPQLADGTRELSDPYAEHGRGLAIVAAVATKWGVQPLAVGKMVWFECAPGDSPSGSA